jgi:DNA invertase Pin-like site-specific DNA recombinase
VTKLDRLARSWPTRAIAGELTTRQIILSLGGSVDDPTDAVGRLLFNVPVMVAEVAEQFGVGRSTLYRAIERQHIEARAGLTEATSKW